MKQASSWMTSTMYQVLDNVKNVAADVILSGEKKGSLFVMSVGEAYVKKTSQTDSATTWHARLGHVGYQILQQISSKRLLDGLPTLKNVHEDVVCQDLMGPTRTPSCSHNHYVMVLVDDYSRKGWRCMDPTTKKSITSRDVMFDEISSWKTVDEVLKVAALPDNSEKQIYQNIEEDSESPNRNASRKEGDDTVCYEEAKGCLEWEIAMQDEIEALRRNDTWELVPKPENSQPVTCKWVYRLKKKSDGTIDRYKARLVARGFSQSDGLYYEETFSPVAKMVTVRSIFSLAAFKNWKIWQLDVNNAFLYGELDREVLMEQPPGFVSEEFPTHVCLLKNALYGLKQAPRAWYGKVAQYFIFCGFRVVDLDSSLFVKTKSKGHLLVLLYVDDMLITGENEAEISCLRNDLSVCFEMKNLGEIGCFLGLEVKKTGHGFFVSQRSYAKNLLDRFGMGESNGIATPMEPYLKLNKEEWQPLSSCKVHDDFKLKGFTDADWAGDASDRRSTSGYCFNIGSAVVSWCSKKQSTVALSSTEAEYMAATIATQECIWLKRLIGDIYGKVNYTVPIECDNESAIRLASNPVFHGRTKHVEIHHHFVREKVLNQEVELKGIHTNDQVADIFTKALAKPKFESFKTALGVIDS
ncbi:UNVERIFIED_CONTAM: Retrovirus-related Pol polyprotein from transposon RE1, partial [Sesamum angustifolium]